MNRASLVGQANNSPKITVQTDLLKMSTNQSSQKNILQNHKIRLSQANNGMNTPLSNQGQNIMGSQSVKNMKMGNLLSPTNQLLTMSPFSNSNMRKSSQVDNNQGMYPQATTQFGIQNQTKKDSLARPSTAAAAAASMVGKMYNRKHKGSLVNSQYYGGQMNSDLNQENIDYQNENHLQEEGQRRPQTGKPKTMGVSSQITAEFQQELEQKMYFLQHAKDQLNNALTGLYSDDKSKLFEVVEPQKQEIKLEHGVQKLDMPQQTVELEKYGFKYFKIFIRNKAQPLFICNQLNFFVNNLKKNETIYKI